MLLTLSEGSSAVPSPAKHICRAPVALIVHLHINRPQGLGPGQLGKLLLSGPQ